MLLASAGILFGLLILIWGADRFVAGAAGLSRNLGVSPLVIGLTVVAFGTSAPEMMVSLMAALDGAPGIAIGNAIGSNIANIGLILGATAVVAPLTYHSRVLKSEYPILIMVSLGIATLLIDAEISPIDGALMIAGLGFVLWRTFKLATSGIHDPITEEYDAEIPKDLSTGLAIFWTLIGLSLLLAGSKSMVWGATEVALFFGVSDLVIGLTIVAIGTSLPELAASLASVAKNEHDLAVGNVIGSNIFNSLAVLSIPAFFGPTAVESAVIMRDIPVMLGLTLAILMMGRHADGSGRVLRWQGALLLTTFVAYQIWLYVAD